MLAAGAESPTPAAPLKLGLLAFQRLLATRYEGLSEADFEREMMALVEQANAMSSHRMAQARAEHTAHQRGQDWSPRLLSILDIDGSGSLDRDEWNLLYEAAPSLDPNGAEAAFVQYSQGTGRVDLKSLGNFITDALGHLGNAEFESTMGGMLEMASMRSSHRVHHRKLLMQVRNPPNSSLPYLTPQLPLQAKLWSQRIIAVLDLDDNGVLDQDEFARLYAVIPGAHPNEAAMAYRTHASETLQGVDQEGFEAFLAAQFRNTGLAAFDEIMLTLTEEASSQSDLKAKKKKKLSVAEVSLRAREWSGRLFTVMDVDGSGDLNEEEFKGLHSCLETAGVSTASTATGDFCSFMCVGGEHNGKMDRKGLTGFLEKALANATEDAFVTAVAGMMERASMAAASTLESRDRLREVADQSDARLISA